MKNLQVKNIGELPIIIGDGNYSSKYPKASDFLKTGIPFISNKDIKRGKILKEGLRYISQKQHAELKKGHLKEGDILISTRANIGDVAWVRKEYEDANINAQLVFLRADEKVIHNRYLYFLLSSEKYKSIAESFSGGSAQAQLPIKDLIKIPIEFPDYHTQVNIASILTAYDELIENNEKRIKILEETAQLLYTEWFVKFNFPGHEKVKMVDSGTEYGMIPEEWEVKKIGELLTTVKRKTKLKTSEYQLVGKYPVVDQGADFIAGYTDNPKTVYSENLIVFGDHSRCYKYCNFEFACGADGTQLLKTNDENKVPQSLLYYLVINSGLQSYSYARHFKFLKEINVLISDKITSQKFDKFVGQNYKQIQTLKLQNINLSKIRDLLIPQLVTGKRKLC